MVEWTCNYGDGRLYRNVTIGELEDGQAVRVTDYWGEPVVTPAWRQPLTDRLDMPGDGIWPDNEHLGHYSARVAVSALSGACGAADETRVRR